MSSPSDLEMGDAGVDLHWPRVSWGIFILLTMAAAAVSLGASVSAGLITVFIVGMVVAWRYPQFVFYASLATAPLLGVLVSVSTGALSLGARVFGGAIDIPFADLLVSALLVVWALRLLSHWRRRAPGWRPWVPLLGPFLFLVMMHILTMVSPAAPDPILVLKYSLRPVLFAYLAWVVVPANFIRDKRQLAAALFLVACVGLFFAFDGFRSVFNFSGNAAILQRAHPMDILEISPLGGNHNALAEILLFAAPAALGWALLVKDARWKNLAVIAAAFMIAIALLTLARSAWIALACEVAFLVSTVWKPWVKRHMRTALLVLVVSVPLVFGMVVYSLQPDAQSSTAARAMITGIALDLFRGSPWVGVGAGQFVSRVGQVEAFTVEFGDPLESHGVLQKLLAETGIFGVLAFGILVWVLFRELRDVWRLLKRKTVEAEIYAYLVAAVIGAGVYQLFDTTYWTSRLWLPVGVALAAGAVFVRLHAGHDPDFLSDHA